MQIECHLLFRHSLISKQGMQFPGILSQAHFVCLSMPKAAKVVDLRLDTKFIYTECSFLEMKYGR